MMNIRYGRGKYLTNYNVVSYGTCHILASGDLHSMSEWLVTSL